MHETNPANGLVIDKTAADWPASIAATGLALACYPVSVERGFMSRATAVERTLATLRFFWNSPQGPEPDATGFKGFYYHFLDMQTGRRAWQCEALHGLTEMTPTQKSLFTALQLPIPTPAALSQPVL